MYTKDEIRTKSGEKLTITFFGHASLLIGFEGKTIYLDPVGAFADYSNLPKADVILVTHQHDDHLDVKAIKQLHREGTILISTKTVAEEVSDKLNIEVMNNGDRKNIGGWLDIEALPAYNTTEGRQVFHPDTGRDNGYIITLGGTRIYFSGDSEVTPEMRDVKNIDVAFLSVNQPFTMTEEQAAEAAKIIRPAIFYPYHYGQTTHKTDTGKLASLLSGSGIDVRIRSME